MPDLDLRALSELRIVARLAWNSYPDNDLTRQNMIERDHIDPISSGAWDRVVTAIADRLIEDRGSAPEGVDARLAEATARAEKAEAERDEARRRHEIVEREACGHASMVGHLKSQLEKALATQPEPALAGRVTDEAVEDACAAYYTPPAAAFAWARIVELAPASAASFRGRMRAALEVARRHLGSVAVPVGWELFSTAPEDGSEILVYRADAGVFTAHYVEADAHLATPDNPPEGDFYWFSTSGDDLSGDLPTHWMPLPAPPAPQGESA